MPPLYCIKFGLVCAGLIMAGVAALLTLIQSISSLGVKHQKSEPGDQKA